jgi:hypothetical protein
MDLNDVHGAFLALSEFASAYKTVGNLEAERLKVQHGICAIANVLKHLV